MYGSGYDSGCIGSERDPATHGRMKRSLTAAFSAKALAEQESLIQSCVDQFVEALGSRGTSAKGLELCHWLEMVAFDVLGEMAFGESFHCIDKGRILVFFPLCCLFPF